MTLRHAIALAVLAMAIAGQWVLDANWDRASEFAWGATLHGIATVAYVWLCRAAVRGGYRPRFVQALAVVLVLRSLALPLQPALSDDIYRYMHEGNMVVQGENPYLTAPADVRAELRHPEYWAKINNSGIPAAYPPAMQYALAVGVTISPKPLGMKIVFGLCDALVFVVLWRWLPTIGVPARHAVIHGFCPLVVLEFAGEGHGDSLAVLFLVLSLWMFSRLRDHVASGCLAVATAGKLLPVVFLPFIARRTPIAVLTFVGVLAALYAPFVLDSAVTSEQVSALELFRGTWEYGDRWRSNDSLFHLLHLVSETVLSWLRAAGVDTVLQHYPHRIAKVPVVLFGSALLVLAWRRRWAPHRVAAATFLTFVAATPVLHPWYVAFVVPFLCIYPRSSWLVFTGTVYLAYHVLPGWVADGRWDERVWVKVVEYLPFYAGFAAAYLDTRRPRATS